MKDRVFSMSREQEQTAKLILPNRGPLKVLLGVSTNTQIAPPDVKLQVA